MKPLAQCLQAQGRRIVKQRQHMLLASCRKYKAGSSNDRKDTAVTLACAAVGTTTHGVVKNSTVWHDSRQWLPAGRAALYMLLHRPASARLRGVVINQASSLHILHIATLCRRQVTCHQQPYASVVALRVQPVHQRAQGVKLARVMLRVRLEARTCCCWRQRHLRSTHASTHGTCTAPQPVACSMMQFWVQA